MRHILPQQFKIAENRHQQIVEVVRHATGELAEALELLHLVHLRQRRLALAGPLLDPLLQFRIGLRQLRGALGDPALQLGVELLELRVLRYSSANTLTLARSTSGTTGTGT